MESRALVVVMDRTILGGVELSILELMRVVHSWGATVHLITQERGTLFPEFEKIAASILIAKFPYPTKPKSWVHLPSFLWKAQSFFKKINAPITLLSSDVFSLWAALWLQQADRPVYGFWQGEFDPTKPKDIQKWIRYGAKRAHGLLANECLAVAMNDSELLKPSIVNAVNIPICVDRWDPNKYANPALKQQLGWAKNKKIALCIGRITPQKGQLALVENFFKRPQLMNQWQLVLAGPIEDDAYKAQFTQLLAIAAPHSVRYIGARADVPELMSSADCILYPGRHHEGFCLVVAEALLMGKPVIAYGGGTIPYLLGDDYPGLVPYEDYQALYDCWQEADLNHACWNKRAQRNKVLTIANRAQFEAALKKALAWG